MFNPTFTEEQAALVDTARKFAAEQIMPHAQEWDEEEKFPLEVFEAAWELGLMNVEVPE